MAGIKVNDPDKFNFDKPEEWTDGYEDLIGI